MNCYLFEAPIYLVFASDLPELLYYSHIPATVVALLVGLFVYLNGRKNLLNKLLLLIALCFSLWTFVSLIQWTNVNGDLIAFLWTALGIIYSLISVLSIYFIYVFIYKKDISFTIKLIFLFLLLPVFLFAHTNLNVSGVDLTNCDSFLFEGLWYKAYYSALGYLAMVWILVLLFKNYHPALPEFKKQILLMGIGIEAFLFLFNTLYLLGTLDVTFGDAADSRLELYGLFGMMIFMVFVGILIVRFKTFNVGAVAANTLVVALLVLVGSQFTFATSKTSIVLTAITLLLTTFAGYILVRSVRKEITQRIEIERLAVKLEKANKRLKVLDQTKSEFVSIASHQLRSPLTSIRGYASMLLEGSFGKLTTKSKEAIERIADSSRYMALSIEDYLNVSRIEAGRMKYEMSDFNLKEIAERITDDLRPAAIKKGLILTSKTSSMTSRGIVNGDIGKTQQIIHNLIDNAMKYTPKGTITVCVRDNKSKKKIYVDVIDTGVGMDEDTIDDVFEKFVRARNANQVNVTGTGLGLYVARQMAEGMKGTISVSSAGSGKGSTFTLELPLSM